MRYVIYGAGAIGGCIGARLFQAGQDIVLIARGAHLEAIRRDGLRFRTPAEDVTLPITAVGHPSEIAWRDGDVALLTMKSQDTAAALDALRAALRPGSGRTVDVPVVCAQNGVANERMALRRSSRVYGMLVVQPSVHLEPGVVMMHATTVGGVLDAGRYPSGVDAQIEGVCGDLTSAGFEARPDANVMRLKYGKLIMNLGNAVQALCGPEATAGEFIMKLRSEATACYEAAGIEAIPLPELQARAAAITMGQIEGQSRWGGSSWQSLARGAGSIETDFINGEIALLGRLHGVPTPCNETLQRLANEAVRDGRQPGSRTVEEVVAEAKRLREATEVAP